MKKIDLHIHTVKTISDRSFEFSIDTFKRYVADAKLDAVAVTNHDIFDAEQFQLIKDAVPIVVFPGIEINVDAAHVLVIARPTDIDDFKTKTAEVSGHITKLGDSISVDELIAIFGDLANYLIIPHYDKRPAITGETLDKLRPYISAGEVDSAKKFVRNVKDPAKPTPVLFSDSRMAADFTSLPTRQTFVDCGDVTLEALKACLKDKAKVALSERYGNKLWQVFDDGQQLSTGLNVVIGARSTGKSYTLDRISNEVRNIKYIKQFQLVQHDSDNDEREFTTSVERRRSIVLDQYLAGLKRVLDGVVTIDLEANDRRVSEYVTTLLRAAEETDKRDAFSNATLFDEVEFSVENPENLEKLIRSIQHLIENIEHRPIIEKHVERAALKSLARELIELFRAQSTGETRKKLVNELVRDIKQGLSFHTSAPQVLDVDLYSVSLDKRKVARFTEIVESIRKNKVVSEDTLQGFKIEVR
ncbi:PHP domain-containing protein, partial [Variovorax sp.]|uniref:PHP domain-containing protein n=2 Tax=Comamonadaceae TaxID=80864 RepID=UPI001AD1706E